MPKTDFVYGVHAVKSLLSHSPARLVELFIQRGREEAAFHDVIKRAEQLNIPIHVVDTKQLDQKVGGVVHQGIVANAVLAEPLHEADLIDLLDRLEEPPFLLILDQVQDPHNLGACLRTADAFGVHAVIVPKDNAAVLTPVVRKVASGAAETVPFVQVTNLVRTIKQLQSRGIWIYGAAGEAEQSLYQTKLEGPIAIVMGAEGEGMRRLTRETCDVLLKIPMQGSVSSLNVSVATAVFLSEVAKRRIF